MKDINCLEYQLNAIISAYYLEKEAENRDYTIGRY
jgi:hypothetical protein